MARIEGTDQRRCARPACNAVAAASFNFDGLRRLVWLGPLDRDAGHSAGDLCSEHAERFSVPRHWELHDLRDAAPATVPASGPELVTGRPRPLAPAAAVASPAPATIERRPMLVPATHRRVAPAAARTPLLARAFRSTTG